VREMEGNI